MRSHDLPNCPVQLSSKKKDNIKVKKGLNNIFSFSVRWGFEIHYYKKPPMLAWEVLNNFSDWNYSFTSLKLALVPFTSMLSI